MAIGTLRIYPSEARADRLFKDPPTKAAKRGHVYKEVPPDGGRREFIHLCPKAPADTAFKKNQETYFASQFSRDDQRI